MLNTLYIRTFLTVVDAGNYTAAAEQLHMSQPAVSQHIRALEEQLGDVRLFRRVGQRMVPTHAGEELLTAARELMTLAERTEQKIRSLRGKVTGRVLIGCTPSSGEYLLPLLLAAFREQFPAVALSVQVASSDLLLDALAEQQIALLLMEEQQRRRGWEAYMLGREPLHLLAAAEHPLLQEEEVPSGMLRDQPFILPSAYSPLRRMIEDSMRRRGVTITETQVALECDSIAFALQGARNGLGLAFVPGSRLEHAHGLKAVALAGTALNQEWYLLRERGRSLPRAAQELYDFLTGPTAAHILEQHGFSQPV
jgi:DNA-binding transcriptional LysR family regulator